MRYVAEEVLSTFPQVTKVCGFHQNWERADLSRRSFHMKGLTGGRKRSRKTATQMTQKADSHCAGTAQQRKKDWSSVSLAEGKPLMLIGRLLKDGWSGLQLWRVTTSTDPQKDIQKNQINRAENTKRFFFADENLPEENAHFSYLSIAYQVEGLSF